MKPKIISERRKEFAAWLAASLFVGATPAAAQSPEELRKLLDQGKADEAYQLGRRAPARLGTPAFDFVFGVAAVNSGHAAEGVLALERFVLALPDEDAGRVELARGYRISE